MALGAGVAFFYAEVRSLYNNDRLFRYEIHKLQESLKEKEIIQAKTQFQLDDLRTLVAIHLPQTGQAVAQEVRDWSRSLRLPASTSPAEENIQPRSTIVFTNALRLFENRDYAKSIKEFHRLIDEFPSSPYVIRSYLYIVDAHMQKREFRNATLIVNQMLDLFPDSQWTGYGLLRLGQMSEMSGEREQAATLYRMVFDNFDDPVLKDKADKLEKGLSYE
jgi:TolA-binding protein